MQLTVRDASRILRVPEKQIFRWIDDGTLPAHLVNEQYRFNRAELLEWATANKIDAAADVFREQENGLERMTGLLEALEAGGIFRGVKGADKESVLRAVVNLLKVGKDVDREFLHGVLLAREALGSTGIGDGIAIPHVRNPIVLHVTRPTITLCFLDTPVDFCALDGQPVHTLFSLISPTVRSHLHMLSRLAFTLRDPGFKALLGRRAPDAELLREVARIEGQLGAPSASAPEPRSQA
ncbi:MAG: PTS sugar transporter subunit IIA [Candidatus Schekmanbacteria bacterium]|nr:PTS sugar transporter subunit IIA [Candidatus Schekmanbacteria bacterium]